VKRVRAFVSGRVQGVAFRFATLREAERLGVSGCARNLRDGRVEVVFEGEDAAVDRGISFLRRGPPLAVVERVELRDEAPTGLVGFRIG
jgi:acylphosphatase